MELKFEGRITEIREPRTGTGSKGDWASVEFEVTELNPQNADYPQIGLFDMFKNGEHTKYAADFKTYYKLGDAVEVEFNLKKNEYTNKEGKLISFYKTSAWRINKVEGQSNSQPQQENNQPLIEEEEDDLPF